MFIGLKAVDKVAVRADFVYVTYDNGEAETLSKKMYDASLSESPQDDTALRDQYVEQVCKDILGVLLEWDVKTGDLESIYAKLQNTIHYNGREADKILWNGKNKRDVRFSDLDRVLKASKDKGNEDSSDKEVGDV